MDDAVVDGFFEDAFLLRDPVLDDVREAADRGGLPDIAVSPAQGRFLTLLVEMCSATRVLEVGTLGGYSAICLARGGAQVTTLELDPHHAEVAAASVGRAGLADRVEVRVGPAADSLAALVEAGTDPYDLVFVDADKKGNPHYVRQALLLSHPGTVIVVDNVVRGGRILDEADDSPDVAGTREVLRLLGSDDRLHATAIQTVGAKGWDGSAIARVR